MIFFDFSALGGPGFPAPAYPPEASPPQNHGFLKGFGRVLASRRVPPFSWRLQSTKNQYFLSLEHQKSIFSVPRAPKINIFYPGAPKINIFCPRSTKNQYFLSPWQSTKNQYLLSPEHHNSIFSLRIRLTNNQTPSAVAGTQLCCALDNNCVLKNRVFKNAYLKIRVSKKNAYSKNRVF